MITKRKKNKCATDCSRTQKQVLQIWEMYIVHCIHKNIYLLVKCDIFTDKAVIPNIHMKLRIYKYRTHHTRRAPAPAHTYPSNKETKKKGKKFVSVNFYLCRGKWHSAFSRNEMMYSYWRKTQKLFSHL